MGDPLPLKCLSWNIEGSRRNHLNLKFFCDDLNPDLIFLSEPQVFQCDLGMGILSRPFKGAYSILLNSEETTQPELSLDTSRAYGGTMIMIMWKSELDPFIEPLTVSSPAFLPIIQFCFNQLMMFLKL